MKKSIYTREAEILRDLLRHCRERGGLTQAALAARVQRPQSFVAKVERGERRLDVLEFLEYARALRVRPRRLLAELELKIEQCGQR